MPNPLELAFEQLLHSLNAAAEPNVGLIFDVMHRTKFTGSFTVHCDRGTPQFIEIGRPIRIDLTRQPRSDA
jgi:hypothetical protein